MDNSLHSLHEVIQICSYLYSVVVAGGGGDGDGGMKSNFFSKKCLEAAANPIHFSQF
jgi:hypothetical protein